MTSASTERVLSLDTLRGFDMLWIIGGGVLFQRLGEQTDWGWADALAAQMHHAKWGQYSFFDQIFPLFIFLAGAAIPYALIGKLEKGAAKRDLYLKISKRAAILVVLGIVYNGGLRLNFDNMRIASVLAQIGISYWIGAMVAINFPTIKRVAWWCVGILGMITILHLWVPVPEFGAGVLTREGSINGYIDRLLLPGKLLGKHFDPEGVLCVLSAGAVSLMGVAAGMVLRSNDFQAKRKFSTLAIVGVACVSAALVAESWYPSIKAIWTATYDLLTGGISFLMLALFYLVIDVWKFQRWTFVFRVIGLNSITIYLANRAVDFDATSEFLFLGIAKQSGTLAPVVLALGVLGLEWGVLYFLYRKNVFLRV